MKNSREAVEMLRESLGIFRFESYLKIFREELPFLKLLIFELLSLEMFILEFLILKLFS